MKFSTLLHGQKGFTLAEMMIATFLSALVGAVIFEVSHTGQFQINERSVKMNIQDTAREGLYRMTQEMRQSSPSRVTVAADGNSIEFEVPDPDNLVDADYALNWAAAHTIEYALSGTQIIRTDKTSGLSIPMANDVTDVDFSGNSATPSVVTITMSVQRTTINGRSIPETPLQMTAEAEVRNL